MNQLVYVDQLVMRIAHEHEVTHIVLELRRAHPVSARARLLIADNVRYEAEIRIIVAGYAHHPTR